MSAADAELQFRIDGPTSFDRNAEQLTDPICYSVDFVVSVSDVEIGTAVDSRRHPESKRLEPQGWSEVLLCRLFSVHRPWSSF